MAHCSFVNYAIFRRSVRESDASFIGARYKKKKKTRWRNHTYTYLRNRDRRGFFVVDKICFGTMSRDPESGVRDETFGKVRKKARRASRNFGVM